jgi:hypothetical protein
MGFFVKGDSETGDRIIIKYQWISPTTSQVQPNLPFGNSDCPRDKRRIRIVRAEGFNDGDGYVLQHIFTISEITYYRSDER